MKNTLKVANHGNTVMVAHRGLSGIERENTCSSFVAAANRSYFGIETDVRCTIDGKFVLSHDDSTARNCNDKLIVEETTFATLRKLQYKDKDESFDRGDLMMPTLAEYIKICKTYGKKCVLEIKGTFTEEQCRGVVDIIRDMDYLDSMIFISFSWDSLINLRAVYPEAVAQFLTHKTDPMEVIDKIAEQGFGIDANYKYLTEENIKALHAKGIVVNCWTVDTIEDAEKLISWGVDQITTNIVE